MCSVAHACSSASELVGLLLLNYVVASRRRPVLYRIVSCAYWFCNIYKICTVKVDPESFIQCLNF